MDDDEGSATGPRERIAFTSVRDGERQLYLLDLGSGQARRLTSLSAGASQPDWSPDGLQVVFTSSNAEPVDLWIVDAEGGEPEQLPSDRRAESDPAWAPYGERIAYVANRDDAISPKLYIRNLADGTDMEIGIRGEVIRDPAWSPDGARIAVTSLVSGGDRQIFIVPVDGGEARQLTAERGTATTPAWAPDGRTIAYTFRPLGSEEGMASISAVDVENGIVSALTSTQWRDSEPSWSPDGQRIIFVSDRDGRAQLYTMSADGSDPERLTRGSSTLDFQPAWGPTG